MSYALWSANLQQCIEIPDSIEKYNYEKQSTFGGRCFPMQSEYKSKYYDDIKSGNMTYEELKKTIDYIFNADVKSLYPAAMRGVDEICKVRYPVGKSRWSDKGKEEFDNGKLGFYSINFKCPRNIRIPILPRKSINGGLEWSLYDGSGVYSNVDIENAIDSGYTIEFLGKSLVWDKCSSNVFTEYIDKYYKMKSDAEISGNEVERSIAKLMINAMYGKPLQKAIFQSTIVVNNYNELLDCFRKSKIIDINIINDNKLLVTCECLNKEEKITKPTQLGAFILSYSRRIMLFYMKAIDPSLQSLCFTYTDTDSLHITAENEKKLRAMGLIQEKLGYLSNDIKKEGIIIAENNLAPKLYRYEYIDNLNRINGEKNKITMKAKGIPKQCLKYEMYDLLKEDQECDFSGLKRKHVSLTSSDKKAGLKHFSIVNCNQTRTFHSTTWTGFNRYGNEWFPRGYNSEKNEDDIIQVKVKHNCACGGNYTCRSSHKKSKMHLNYIANNNIDE
jgi:hypothetical protein